MQLVEGWIFDVYPVEDKIVVWIKEKNQNKIIRLQDSIWKHSLYVAADYRDELLSILEQPTIAEEVADYEFVSKYERITDTSKSTVLKLELNYPAKAVTLAKQIQAFGGRFDRFQLYNADLLPAQYYFYDRDLFPLAFGRFGASIRKAEDLIVQDNVYAPDYRVPIFKGIHLRVNLKKEGKISKPTDRVNSISIQTQNDNFQIQKESEVSTIQELMKEVNTKIDPDFVFTDDGDSFTFPYLIYRAEVNGIPLIMSREPIPLKKPDRKGSSYVSYGKVYFKPTTTKLLGRIHIDISNSFFLDEGNNGGGLHGLYEISRLCRMPLHTASRASIGRCLSSLQFYYATKKDILIPWKPTLAEHFKSFEELLVADRGGFIFEPELGIHEQAAEFDFVSLYPSIMLQKNISAETVHCYCCHNSKFRVPELDYNVCEKRTGIVPTSLGIVLEKRAVYKKLKQDININKPLRSVYDARQSALKWILVTSFGYLGFNNAKFGRIDAHISVCAFDRQIFLQAVKIAEKYGFRVIHGIVDSIWMQKNGAERHNYLELKGAIENMIGFSISFEGIYRWIAFLHSKITGNLPVVNRYFGAFENSNLKIRGIETRRRDTPTLFTKFQNELLDIMAAGHNIEEVRRLIPTIFEHFEKYKQQLKDRNIQLEELAFTKRRSKSFNEYQIDRKTVENNAMKQLNTEGKLLEGGQILKYVITNYKDRRKNHSKSANTRNIPVVTPLELVDNNTLYDIERYIELLAQTCNSVIEPFK
jgi:DNA polymerase elongation subunit (family B)